MSDSARAAIKRTGQQLLQCVLLSASLCSFSLAAAPDNTTAVSITTPERQTLRQTAKALGVIETEDSPSIAAEISGRIVKITADEGAKVARGDVLVELDDRQQQLELAASEAQLRRLQVLTDNQARKYGRLQTLAKSQSVSNETLQDTAAQLRAYETEVDLATQQLALSRLQLTRTKILSPLDAQVSARHRSVGDYVNPGTALLDLVATDRLRARLYLPERHAALVKQGQPVELFSPASQQRIQGAVISTNPTVAGASRVVAVLVGFSNSAGWMPGASVDATIVLDERSNAFVIPKLSITTRHGVQIAFVEEGGVAMERQIDTGWREGQWVEVLSGLDEKDRVIVDGTYQITDKSSVTVVGGKAP
tara:strand:- start:3789 stop:4883 length:1095 start_codon:yes stop_codon:yes gene_type:complete